VTRARLAFALVATGALAVLTGVAMVYIPAAIVLAGGALVATGLLGIDVGGEK
jgi:hypothetical protein